MNKTQSLLWSAGVAVLTTTSWIALEESDSRRDALPMASVKGPVKRPDVTPSPASGQAPVHSQDGMADGASSIEAETVQRDDLPHAKYEGWARAQPLEAVWTAVYWPEDALRASVLRAAALRLAEEDLQQALRLLQDLPPGAARDIVVLAVAGETARTNPREAIALLVDLPQTKESHAALSFAADQWGASDPAAAAK